jgi:putative tricarboxylic transport membrane protein
MFVLGPIMEINFRQSLIISKGSFMIFITRPITALVLSVSVLLLAFSALRRNKFQGVDLEA